MAIAVFSAARPPRVLALAAASLLCAMTAGALAITLLGKVDRAIVTLDLSTPDAPRAHDAAPAGQPPDAAPLGAPITKRFLPAPPWLPIRH